jgi:type IV pilus assembly protein PilY1
VDGPISVADVWLGTGSGATKSAADWKTLLVFGLGRGADPYLWSSSSDCLSDFSLVYDATRPHYCGFYAMDVTDTLNPVYRWRITPTGAQAPYLGDPWSKVVMHRLKVNGSEKWVGFMGGGHNWSVCNPYDGTGTDCDKRGKGFFVIDLADGSVLWSYTREGDPNMNYALAGSPAVVDSDLDGFIDTVYIGDLGGNLWRFRFPGDSTAGWTGSRLLARSDGYGPVFGMPTVAKDAMGNLWVYWGTGDKTEPIVVGTNVERFFAVKDSDLSGTWTGANLDNITGTTYTDNGTKHGWYMNLAGAGEKVLGEAVVFGGQVYFTTYTPGGSGVTDPCNAAGIAKLYSVSYISGAGSLTGNARSITLGVGIPTAPTLSLNPFSPTPDLYVTVSGGSGTGATTIKAPVNPGGTSNRTNILHWRDRRLQ